MVRPAPRGRSRRAPHVLRALAPLVLGLCGLAPGLGRAAEPLLVEFHFKPVPGAQIAIWLEDQGGAFVRDVFVTQATGKYGIGNRPGVWNFLSSWRAPYGPRRSVLPVWAHRRGKTYPRLIFSDPSPSDSQSLGWHEGNSSAEGYFCRPLLPDEHATIAVDTMTCPSPQVFQSDKGRFDPDGGASVYPPRNDILAADPNLDAPDVGQFGALNDLDAVTAATPVDERLEYTSALLPPEVAARGPLTAYIEVALEHDENPHYDFDREDDHFVDPRLFAYGIEYLGQPSVVYKVTFDPTLQGFVGAAEYAGYGDWDGASGTLHPPDDTISRDGGSGADRLRLVELQGETFRWGVYAYGPDGVGGGWGHCAPRPLAAPTGLELEGLAFDRVALRFELPPQASDLQLAHVHVYHRTGEDPLTADQLPAAHLQTFDAAELAAETAAEPGAPIRVEIAELWGDFTYQFGVVYEDACKNRSELATAAITTDPQKFQQVDSFCVVATAAYGAPWTAEVGALRAFRDRVLLRSAVGQDLVRLYYTSGPPLARAIAREPLLRALTRAALQPVADAARLATWRDGQVP